MSDHLVKGPCVGGPLDGQAVTVRTGYGFLVVDKAAGKAWKYGPAGDGFAVCTDHDDSLNYPHGAVTGERTLDVDRVWQAGTTSTLDILTVGQG